jgi:conjugal transfer ATP-binding protein TraC
MTLRRLLKRRKGKPSISFNVVDEGETRHLERGMLTKQDLVAPESIDLSQPGYIQIGENSFCRTLVVTGYPREVEPGWLSGVYAFPANIRIGTYVEPIDAKGSVQELSRQMRYHQASLLADAKRGRVPDPYTEAALHDATELRDALARGDAKVFQHHMYITVFVTSLEELNHTTQLIEAELESKLMESRRTTFEQDRGFKTTLPLGRVLLPRARNMDSFSLSTTFPFLSSELTHDNGEIWGINKLNNSIVLLDRFSYMSAHTTTIAASGAGKSYWLKQLLTQSRFQGIGGIIIDPSDREYYRFTKTFGGTYIRLGISSPDRINPFDIVIPKNVKNVADDEKKPVTQKVDYLKSLLEVMLEGLTVQEKALLDDALYEVYRQKGMKDDWESILDPGSLAGLQDGGLVFSLKPKMKEMPTLADLLELLEADPTTEDLANRLRPYVTGSLQIFNGQTNVDLENDLVVFDVHEIVSHSKGNLAPTAYFILTEFIMQKLRQSRKQRVVAIDEAHFLFRYLQTAQFVEALFRIARKLGAGISLITQSINDFLDSAGSKQAMVCLQNSSLVFLMKQQTMQAVDKLQEVFHLSDAEKYFLANADRGEGILLAGNQRVALKVEVPESLHRIITTDPVELARMEEEETQMVEE